MRVLSHSSLLFAAALSLTAGAAAALLALRVGASALWGLAGAAAVAALMLRRARTRWMAVQRRFPARWRVWLSHHVPLYAQADRSARRRFERDVQMFLAEQRFEGVAGVEVTELLRLQVAAGAALLLHGRPDWALPTRRTILFYPRHFDADYFDDSEGDFDGMAHPQGPVILSAPAIEHSWAYLDGQNVVLHELAHLLDFDDTHATGAPSLMDPGSAAAWAELMRQETQRIKNGRSMLRRYAASNGAEFFACATEAFFERPHVMARHHEKLFEALVAFYNLDPRPSGDGAEVGDDDASVAAEP